MDQFFFLMNEKNGVGSDLNDQKSFKKEKVL